MGVEPILSENIVGIVWLLAGQPPHITIGVLDVMPTALIPLRTTIVRKT